MKASTAETERPGHGRARRVHRALALLALLLPAPVAAQPDLQITPDGLRTLINEDVGAERWAVGLNASDGSVTGNVYRTDGGDPQLVWCREMAHENGQVRLRCRGTQGCAAWDDLGEVRVPASFVEPSSECPVNAAHAPPPGRAFGAGTAAGAGSTLRLSPDGKSILINKDFGGLRWAIVLDLEDDTVTGNVFSPGGGPARFVSCERVHATSDAFTYSCVGAGGCGCAPCPDTDWQPLAEVTLPRDFFEDRRCGTDGAASAPLADRLAPMDASALERFGENVAVSGDLAVVTGISGGMPSRVAYVFERAGGAWMYADTLAAPDLPDGELFGFRAAIADAAIVVASRVQMHVFARRVGRWTEVGRLALPPVQTHELEVTDLAASGDTIVVSAGGFGTPSRVLVYRRGTGGWQEPATLYPSVLPQGVSFAGSVAIEDDTIVVGTSDSWGSPSGGAAYVYERRQDSWIETALLTSSDGRAVDGFGGSVAISGNAVLVGAGPGFYEDFRRHDGAAYVFERDGDGYRQAAKLTACGIDTVRFGSLVDIAGDLAVVGGHEPAGGGAAGDVYLFERAPSGWQEKGKLEVSDGRGTRSGNFFALDGTTAVVGAPAETAAYAFDLERDALLPPDACPPPPEPPPLAWPTEGWSVESPADHGMSSILLERARDYAFQPENHTQGVVVVRHGAIVAEWYEPERSTESFAASWSMAKSFAGSLIGIAIADGLIDGVDVSLAEFYPDWAGTDKAKITLRDVLTMSSGLDWTEDYATDQTPLSGLARLASQESDQLSFVVARPLAHEPGTVFYYSSADTMLLSGVLEAATGMTAEEYAQKALFDPLGMAPVEWWSDVPGNTLTYCCIDTPTREFAKFGLLYDREGRWGDRQIVPAEWVRESTAPSPTDDGYGYQWWLDLRWEGSFPLDTLSARGFDGQYMYVFPSLDLVVVRNGHYDKDPGPPVADPNLFAHYPSAGLVPGLGTIPPASWDHSAFIQPILDSIVE